MMLMRKFENNPRMKKVLTGISLAIFLSSAFASLGMAKPYFNSVPYFVTNYTINSNTYADGGSTVSPRNSERFGS